MAAPLNLLYAKLLDRRLTDYPDPECVERQAGGSLRALSLVWNSTRGWAVGGCSVCCLAQRLSSKSQFRASNQLRLSGGKGSSLAAQGKCD